MSMNHQMPSFEQWKSQQAQQESYKKMMMTPVPEYSASTPSYEEEEDCEDHAPVRPPPKHRDDDDCEEWEVEHAPCDDGCHNGENVVITHIDNRFLYVAPIVNNNNMVVSNVNRGNSMMNNNNVAANIDAEMMKKMMWMKKMKAMKMMNEEGKMSDHKMEKYFEHAREMMGLDHEQMQQMIHDCDEVEMERVERPERDNQRDNEREAEMTESASEAFGMFGQDNFFDDGEFEIEW